MTHKFYKACTNIFLSSNLLTLRLPRWSDCLQMVGELRMSLDMMHIMGFFISFMFFVCILPLENIYLICGKIGHIII
jgi:hypothetical protein